MNDLQNPRFRDVLARRPDHLDDLLRRFFRSEMPDPWPEPPQFSAAPRPQGQPSQPPRRRRWFPQSGRLALAAAISFFLVGYLLLSACFPESPVPGLVPVRPDIGLTEPKRPQPKQFIPIQDVVPMRGGKAQIDGVQFRGPGRWSVDFTVKRIPSAKMP